jgi:hypothetical protein
VKAEGGYTLHGTPPFTIVTGNGTFTEYSDEFGQGTCITSITDFTYNPKGFLFDPPMTVTANAPTPVCADAVTFTATASGGVTDAMSYTWNITGAETTTTSDNPYITTLATTGDADTYTYTVFVTNANGCTSTVSEAGTVTVYAVPVVHSVSSETVCSGMSATLSANVTGATPSATYTWYVEGYPAETTATNTYTTPALTATATTYISYTVQITNDTGCTSTVSDAGTITVNPLPVPVFLSAPTAPVCPNSEATFTVAGADPGPGSYCFRYDCPQCLINNFLTGEEVPPAAHCLWASTWVCGTADTYSIVMPDSGTMTVWVQAMNQYGCTNTASTVVTIYDAFDAGSIITASTTTAPDLAPSVTVASVAPASGGDGPYTYQWRRSGTSAATLSGYDASYALNTDVGNYDIEGIYYFTRYAKDGTCNTEFTASGGQYTLTVFTPPTDSWTCNTQTWSQALRTPVAGCESTSTLSTDNPPPAQYKDNGSAYGYYYNWTCVIVYKDTLCPSPWSVPSRTDFDTLMSCSSNSELVSAWGLPGYAAGDIMAYVGIASFLWTTTELPPGSANSFVHQVSEWHVGGSGKQHGFPVRCVR